MPNSSQRPLISFDWAIKRLLRQKANFGILEGFLSELLKQDITVQSIPESETNKNSDDDKTSRVDILCENTKGELLLIELQ
jgi:predicted transposase/invertase (TIGR01784 family)